MGKRCPFSMADFTVPANLLKHQDSWWSQPMMYPYPVQPEHLASPITPKPPAVTAPAATAPAAQQSDTPEYDAPHWSYLHGCQKHRGEVVPCLKCIQARDPEITRDGVLVYPPIWTYGSPTVDERDLDWNTLAKHEKLPGNPGLLSYERGQWPND